MGSLGIRLTPVRRVVSGRQRGGRRVTYDGDGGRRLIAERIVLSRWLNAGFKGFRLRPNIWRVLGHLPELRKKGLSLEQITRILERKRQEGGDIATLLPRPRLVEALLSALPRRRLDALLERHAAGGEVDPRRPGVPDLFLFKRAGGRRRSVRFVEVKRPGERLKPHQEAEILFMRSIGSKAGVVRLIERTPRR